MSNTEDFLIYCLPVSGRFFCNQLGLLCEIYAAKNLLKNGIFKGSKDYCPDLVMGSSGGNVVAYIGLAADWSDAGIERISRKIKSEIFIKSWLPKELNFIPSWILGSFNGSLYKKGDGECELFHSAFDKETIKNVEIWTGTYDVVHEKTQLFCNLCETESVVNTNFFTNDENIFGSLPLKFLDGDLNKIATISAASAAIPILVEHRKFEGIRYADGGIMYPSPITIMSSEIYRIITNECSYDANHLENDLIELEDGNIKEVTEFTEEINYLIDIDNSCEVIKMKNCSLSERKKEKSLRLIYFLSHEIEKIVQHRNVKYNPIQFLDQIIYSNGLQDKNAALNILRRIAGDKQGLIKNTTFYNMNTQKLANLLKIAENYLHYVLILSPKKSLSISLEKIEENKLIEKIRLSRIDYIVDFWYLKH